MDSLVSILKKAQQTKTALGHFNVCYWEIIKAIIAVAQKTRQPIIIGASEKEARYMGVWELAFLVRGIRERYQIPLFLNADHFKDFGLVQEAAQAGFDSILFDAADLGFEENIKKTREAVKFVKSIRQETLVEGELGYIGTGSEVHDGLQEGVVINESQMPTPEQVNEFVLKTGVDLVGPAVGNLHGIIKRYKENLSFERIYRIKQAIEVPLVLHGASGLSDNQLIKAIEAGISIVHINTELRLLWRKTLDRVLQNNLDEIVPYRLLAPVFEELEKAIENKVKLFAKSEVF